MEKVVFGIMPSYHSSSYALVPVAAELIDGKMVRIDDARNTFPNNGEVYVHIKYIPASFGRFSAGLWGVRTFEPNSDEDEQRDRFALFSAFSCLSPPHEMISVDCNSEHPDAARELLLKGIQLPYRLTADPFIEFSDGVVAGPVRTLPRTEVEGFRCQESALDNPIHAWKRRDAFDLLDVPNHVRTRSFVQAKFIPKSDCYLDLCPLQDAIRSVVRFIAKSGPGTYIIPRREQDLLAEKLSAGGLPEHVEARRERVFRLLQQSVEIPEQLEALMDILLVHPKVEERLKSEENRAFETGKQSLLLKEDGLRKRVETLTAEELRLKQHLEHLTSRIKEDEDRGLQRAEEIEQMIHARALKAKEHAGALLAEVAVLQPFFGMNGTPGPIQKGYDRRMM